MVENNRLYVDLHVLQTVPPSNINRDDTGSPKTALYGGVIRSRVSSQAWKKAVRDDFRENLSAQDLGKRTMHVTDMVADEIRKQKGNFTEENCYKIAKKALEIANVSTKNVLFFINDKQVEEFAKSILKNNEFSETGEEETKMSKKEKDALNKILKTEYQTALELNPSVDMALFGRMAAGAPSLAYDATCQVAHAISTHAVTTEYDYFTAIDDLAVEESSGAAHINYTEYNSSTLYRYANINVFELKKNIGTETIPTVIQFIKSFITSMPTGKQNTFANRTLPYLAYVTIRNDQPISLVGAFEKPVESSENGYEQASAKALEQYTENLYNSFASAPQNAFTVGIGDFKFGEKGTMKDLLAAVEETLTDLIGENKE
jgi:CRISPR system Cascade subunit CasC